MVGCPCHPQAQTCSGSEHGEPSGPAEVGCTDPVHPGGKARSYYARGPKKRVVPFFFFWKHQFGNFFTVVGILFVFWFCLFFLWGGLQTTKLVATKGCKELITTQFPVCDLELVVFAQAIRRFGARLGSLSEANQPWLSKTRGFLDAL